MIIMETGQDYKYVDNLLLSNHGGMIRIYLKGAGDARITLQPYRKTDGSINRYLITYYSNTLGRVHHKNLQLSEIILGTFTSINLHPNANLSISHLNNF